MTRTSRHQFTSADLRTIIPAANPAWIRIIEAYEVSEDDGTTTKEWRDIVFPVLAYATLPDGEGAFLIYNNTENYPSGPIWVTRRYVSNVRVELSVLHMPHEGMPCHITQDHIYISAKPSLIDITEVLYCLI